MTTTNSTTSASGSISSIATGGNSSLKNVNFNTFLTLLVAQLKNQDPLNPMEGTEFTGQLAQFADLEQTINSNTYLQKLVEQRDYGQQTLASSYLGKEVLVPGDKFNKVGDGDVTFGYELEKTARDVQVTIYDSDGKAVRTFSADTDEGRHLITWDGKDDGGTELAAGRYSIEVEAYDSDNKKVVSTAYTYGKVDSVLNEDGDVALSILDGRQVGMDDVMSVQESQIN